MTAIGVDDFEVAANDEWARGDDGNAGTRTFRPLVVVAVCALEIHRSNYYRNITEGPSGAS